MKRRLFIVFLGSLMLVMGSFLLSRIGQEIEGTIDSKKVHHSSGEGTMENLQPLADQFSRPLGIKESPMEKDRVITNNNEDVVQKTIHDIFPNMNAIKNATTRNSLKEVVQKNSPFLQSALRDKTQTDQYIERNEEKVPNEKGESQLVSEKGIVLKTLLAAYDIQDNTITDTWGVILKHDQLPTDMQNVDGYTIKIGDKTYDLKLNKYNENIFISQVSSVEHTREQVEAGIVKVM